MNEYFLIFINLLIAKTEFYHYNYHINLLSQCNIYYLHSKMCFHIIIDHSIFKTSYIPFYTIWYIISFLKNQH